jgi:hypothetical protein
MKIHEVRDYVGEHGEKVERFSEALGTGPELYVGTITFPIRTPRGVRQQTLKFPIPASTVLEAFERFEATAKHAVEAFVTEARKPKLALPGHLNGKIQS